MSDRLFAVIAVENTAFHFDKPYDYIIPSELAEEVQPGVRVLVEFGHAQRQGVVMKVCDSPEQPELSHKPILLVLDSEPIYNDEMIRLAVWLKEHTFCTFFDAFRAMIPAGIYYNIDPIFQAVLQPGEIALSPNDRQVFDLLQTKPEGMNLKKICETLGLTVSRRVVDHLLKLGYLTESREIKRALSDASFRCVRMSCDYDESISLTAKQKSVVELLLQIGAGSVKEVCYFSGVGEGVIKTLEKKGIVDVFEEEYYSINVPKLSYGSKRDESTLAQNVFSVLRDVDKLGVKEVYIHAPSKEGVGLAVYNRLIRACSFEVIKL